MPIKIIIFQDPKLQEGEFTEKVLSIGENPPLPEGDLGGSD